MLAVGNIIISRKTTLILSQTSDNENVAEIRQNNISETCTVFQNSYVLANSLNSIIHAKKDKYLKVQSLEK